MSEFTSIAGVAGIVLLAAACSASRGPTAEAQVDIAPRGDTTRVEYTRTAQAPAGQLPTPAIVLAKPVVIAPDAPKGMWQYLPDGCRGTVFGVSLAGAPSLDAATTALRETAERCWLKKGGNYAPYALAPADASAPDRRTLRLSDKKNPGTVVLTMDVIEKDGARNVRVAGPLADTELVKQIESDLMLLGRRLKDGGPSRCV